MNETADVGPCVLIYGTPTVSLSHHSFSQLMYLRKVFFLVFLFIYELDVFGGNRLIKEPCK